MEENNLKINYCYNIKKLSTLKTLYAYEQTTSQDPKVLQIQFIRQIQIFFWWGGVWEGWKYKYEIK